MAFSARAMCCVWVAKKLIRLEGKCSLVGAGILFIIVKTPFL